MTGDDHLSRRVEIGRFGNLLTVTGLFACRLDPCIVQTKHRCHRTAALRYRFLHALRAKPHQRHGVAIVRRAIEEPLRQIAANGGFEGSVILNKVREGKGSFGWNAATGEYEDLVEAGVIDPTKVVRTALTNAASVGALLLTTEAMIAERPKKDAPAPAPGGGHGHGMGM